MKNSTPLPHISTDVHYLQYLVQKNGPDPEDYEVLDHWIKDTYFQMKQGLIQKGALDHLITKGIGIFSTQSLMGFMLSKPYGYAGDFMIIDKVYRKEMSTNPLYIKWDRYSQRLRATNAVRNRKTYFKNLLKHLTKTKPQQFRILNLASGPCRDLFEFFEENPGTDATFDCVELDPNAIDYAKNLLGRHIHKVRFIQQNIFRFRSSQQYDLVWSAGLFDYFENATFHRILKRLLNNVKQDGEIVIGNFHPRNPSRAFMELLGDWYLHHRTEEQLIDLALKAGVDSENHICIEQEEEGINLFMKIKNIV